MKITKIVFKLKDDGATCQCYQDKKLVNLTDMSKDNLEKVSTFLKALAEYIDKDINKNFNSPCC